MRHVFIHAFTRLSGEGVSRISNSFSKYFSKEALITPMAQVQSISA